MNETTSTRARWTRIAATTSVIALVALLAACVCPQRGKHGETLTPDGSVKWDHRVYRRSDESSLTRTPGPELDKGTFEGYVLGTEYPVAWAWKPDAFKDYEVWVLFKPDQPGGFQRHGSGAPGMPDSYLTLEHEDKDDYGEPMPGKTGPINFRTYVKSKYPSSMGVTDSDLYLFILHNDVDTGATTDGEFSPGLYKVWQTNHDPYVGPPVAWVWQPESVKRNFWFVYQEDTQWGYHLPGGKNPITMVPYTPAAFRFQKSTDTLDEGTIESDYDGAMNAFKEWIMNDPTNDVTDPAQLKLYDHRILKW